MAAENIGRPRFTNLFPSGYTAEDWLAEYSNDTTQALAELVGNLARTCVETLRKTDELFHRKHKKEVAVTGGWAKNRLFLQALEELGYQVVIPPFADLATAAGLAADALVRIGDAKNFKAALKQLSAN